jgi:hypothetical protein
LPGGVKVAAHDLAAVVDAVGKGRQRIGNVETAEATLVPEEAVDLVRGDAAVGVERRVRVGVVPHHLAAVVDGEGKGERAGPREVDRRDLSIALAQEAAARA